MQINLQRNLEEIIPLLIIGIGIALCIGLLLVLSYVLMWGLVIGALLWLGVRIKNAWRMHKSQSCIIEHKSRDQ